MKSIIGNAGAKTAIGTPYITYCYGIKEEGERTPAWFSTEMLAMNALMQNILDEVTEHQGMSYNLVWREFPRIVKESFITSYGDTIELYKATARFCFE